MSQYIEIPSGFEDKILNLDKIFQLDQHNQTIIMDLYQLLVKSITSIHSISGRIEFDGIGITITYNTLVDNGYLITRREKNIDTILS